MHFPPEILRLELEAFAAARTVVVNGAFVEPIETLSALVAGGSYATDCLFLVLAGPCDEILLEHPRHEPSCLADGAEEQCKCYARKACKIHLALYADDLVTLTMGPPEAAATVKIAMSNDIVDALEGALGMQISRGRNPWQFDDEAKSVTLASSTSAALRVRPSMKKIGIRVQKLSEHLGICFQVGVKLIRTKQAARIRQATLKMGRLVRLGTKAGSHVFKTGTVPSMRHGANVVGITVTTMKAINKMAARSKGRTVGRSKFARLAIDNCNLGHLVRLDPIASWTKKHLG